MRGSSQAKPPNDLAITLALAAIGAALAFAGVLWSAAWLAALMTGQAPPTSGLSGSLGVLADPTHPGEVFGVQHLHPVPYWTVTGACFAVITAAGVMLWRLLAGWRQTAADDPNRIPGVASGPEIARAASARVLLGKAATLRPSLAGRASLRPADVGYLLGMGKGGEIWATVEDSFLICGAPRSGKGLMLVINAILDAPGAVVATSTRPDNATITMTARARQGPIAIFDPQGLAPGLDAGMRWSPVRGCQNPLTAMIRAKGLSSSAGFEGVSEASFWEGKTTGAIQCLLHAAALDGKDARTVYQWALSPTAAADAVRILASHSDAAEGWAETLESMVQADPRTRDSIWQGVSLSFSALADPRVLDAVLPRPGEEFDPERFLLERGTLYLLATGAGAGASAGLVAAMVEDLVETAKGIAARSPGARMDPPLLLCLDEVANIAPLPSLPSLMSEGGGSGITCMPVLQSLAQARDRWGENLANAIWDSAIVKILLGGASNSRDLQDLCTLIGERDEETDSVTVDAYGSHSSQRSIRRVPILPPDAIRSLPFGTGVVLLRTAKPIIAKLRPWIQRQDAAELKTARAAIEEKLRLTHLEGRS